MTEELEALKKDHEELTQKYEELLKEIKEAREVKGKPTCIIGKTIKGKGVSFMENQAGWHGKAPNQEEYKNAITELDVK